MDIKIDCPVCGVLFDSPNSYADTRAVVSGHIAVEHPAFVGGK